MPKRRPPREVWDANLRPAIWKRDGGRCVRCGVEVLLERGAASHGEVSHDVAGRGKVRRVTDKARVMHLDHIRSGKNGTNEFKNLRTLCRRCHVLRADMRHRGMIASALRDGIIGADWRMHVWDDE